VSAVKITKVFRQEVSLEQAMCGDWEVWLRLPEAPEMDAKLATVHYHYGFQDNSGSRSNAEKIAEFYGWKRP